jgi:predicted transcriptional regulator
MKQQVRIRSIGDALEGFRKTWKALEQGKKVTRQSGTYFTSLEAARKVLTPKRLDLLRTIRRESPDSLYRLARLVGRDLKNVQEDVRALAELGLVSLKKTRGTSGRPTTAPRVRFKEIEVRIAV